MIFKQIKQKQKFNIFAGEDLIATTPKMMTKDFLIKERTFALQNNNYEKWFRISKLLIDEYM